MKTFTTFMIASCFTIIVNISYLAKCESSHHYFADLENVCNETVTIKKEKQYEQPVKYELKHQAICGFLPCTKVRTEIRMDSRIKTIFEDVQRETCCPGYAETPDRKCAPICLKSCQNGKCIRPGVCKCNIEPTETSPGFVGPTCNRFVCLENNRWGTKCDRECNCPSTAYCSGSTGKCVCRNGWRGLNCTEECDSTMNCDDVELPPIIEPEVNVIDDNLIIGSSQKLTASSQPRSMLGENGEDEAGLLNNNQASNKSVVSLVAAHMGVNLFLLLLTCTLMVTLFWYKKRLNQIRNELYYGPYSTTSSGGSSSGGDNVSANYTNSIAPSRMQNRPRMPTPLEDNFLGKNLNFASATRNILSKDESNLAGANKKHNEARDKYLLDPKVEAHLISSQMSSQQNIYSDINSSFSDKSYKSHVTLENIHENRMLNLIPEEHDYQVPRLANTSITLPEHLDMSEPFIGNIYNDVRPVNTTKVQKQAEEKDDMMEEGESFYEEIKPKSSI